MNVEYTYFIGSILLTFFWLIIFFLIKSRNLKSKMLWSSAWVSLAGFSEHFYVPEYWRPKVLFTFWGHLDIESFIFSFAVGGIAAVLYEMIFNKSFRRISSRKNFNILLIMFLVGFCANFSHLNPIYNTYIALLAGILYLFATRNDLFKEILVGGLLFGALYLLVFGILLEINPNFINQWSLSNLTRVFFLTIPIEELIWAFLFGCVWATLYDDIFNCRLLFNRKQKVTVI